MKFEVEYVMDDDRVLAVDMQGDGLRVQLVHPVEGDFEYRSWDRGETEPIIAPHSMSLPTGLLHAAQFFGMIPPGTITEDVYNGCEYRF